MKLFSFSFALLFFLAVFSKLVWQKLRIPELQKIRGGVGNAFVKNTENEKEKGRKRWKESGTSCAPVPVSISVRWSIVYSPLKIYIFHSIPSSDASSIRLTLLIHIPSLLYDIFTPYKYNIPMSCYLFPDRSFLYIFFYSLLFTSFPLRALYVIYWGYIRICICL